MVQTCHSLLLRLPTLILNSQRVRAPKRESVTCETYSSSYSFSKCDLEYVRRCLDDCCSERFRPLWAGGDLMEVWGDSVSQGRSSVCRHFMLGEESGCLPPCTSTAVQTKGRFIKSYEKLCVCVCVCVVCVFVRSKKKVIIL